MENKPEKNWHKNWISKVNNKSYLGTDVTPTVSSNLLSHIYVCERNITQYKLKKNTLVGFYLFI